MFKELIMILVRFFYFNLSQVDTGQTVYLLMALAQTSLLQGRSQQKIEYAGSNFCNEGPSFHLVLVIDYQKGVFMRQKRGQCLGAACIDAIAQIRHVAFGFTFRSGYR